MEIAVPDLAGSLGGGGRYDNLIGMFLGRDVPACGFSLGLERIIVVMTERGMFPSSAAVGTLDVVVSFMEDQSRADAACRWRPSSGTQNLARGRVSRVAGSLKAVQVRVEPGARLMAIFGENERLLRQVSVRDLQTREQKAVPRAEAEQFITHSLNREP